MAVVVGLLLVVLGVLVVRVLVLVANDGEGIGGCTAASVNAGEKLLDGVDFLGGIVGLDVDVDVDVVVVVVVDEAVVEEEKEEGDGTARGAIVASDALSVLRE